MVGLGQNLEGLGGNGMGRFPWALQGKVFSGVCLTCKSSRVPGIETRNYDSA